MTTREDIVIEAAQQFLDKGLSLQELLDIGLAAYDNAMSIKTFSDSFPDEARMHQRMKYVKAAVGLVIDKEITDRNEIVQSAKKKQCAEMLK